MGMIIEAPDETDYYKAEVLINSQIDQEETLSYIKKHRKELIDMALDATVSYSLNHSKAENIRKQQLRVDKILLRRGMMIVVMSVHLNY